MPKDFNQSTSLESYLKLQWFYSNTSTIIIRTLYVSNINTDFVQLFDLLFHTRPRANYNSVCLPRSIIHLLRQVKPQETHTVCLCSRLLFYSKCTGFTVCFTYSDISLTMYINQ